MGVVNLATPYIKGRGPELSSYLSTSILHIGQFEYCLWIANWFAKLIDCTIEVDIRWELVNFCSSRTKWPAWIRTCYLLGFDSCHYFHHFPSYTVLANYCFLSTWPAIVQVLACCQRYVDENARKHVRGRRRLTPDALLLSGMYLIKILLRQEVSVRRYPVDIGLLRLHPTHVAILAVNCIYRSNNFHLVLTWGSLMSLCRSTYRLLMSARSLLL